MRALALLIFATGLASCERIPGTAESAGVNTIRQELSDPSSAQFRTVHLGASEVRPVAVCGEVNAKNQFGGYVGYRRFMVIGNATVFEHPEEQATYFSDTWGKAGC